MKTENGCAASLARGESGMALLTTMMVMVLISALMAGMFAAVNSDLRANAVDRDQTQVYAAAHAGLEKLTSDLATVFATDVSPSVADITGVATRPPAIPGFEYRSPGGGTGSGYAIDFPRDVNGNPQALADRDITAGPYQGFKGLITPYTVTVTARSRGGSEVRLRRELQTVAVPVFQFGVFSETDLTFYAGDNFDFGGRVHTNGHLFMSELSGFTLTFSDRITAFKDIIRAYLSNGMSVASVGFTGTVRMPTTVGNTSSYRALRYTGPNEGTVSTMPGSTKTDPEYWKGLSTGTYKGNILNGDTGAKKLDLPLVSQGATPIDLIRRPGLNSNEHTANKPVFDQRYFSQASLRILLSDRATDITNLPTVTATAPVQLTAGTMSRSIGDMTFLTNGSTSSTTTTLMLAGGVPAALKPTLRVGTLSGVTCQGMAADRFLACNITAAVSGSTITVSTDGGAISSTTGGPISAGTRDLVLSSSTAPFATRMSRYLWATDSNGVVPISCNGYDDRSTTTTKQLTLCSGLEDAPARGSTVSTYAHFAVDDPLIGGFIKIEKQSATGTWTDVTTEILNLGIGATNQEGTICADPSPNAVLRIQRLRDNGGAGCGYAASTSGYDYWPNALYDAREGNHREVSTTAPMVMGGVMHYISLDVANLKRWLNGTIGTTGSTAWNNNGYIVYFSDRRGNHEWPDAGDRETGEYGWEDIINPLSAAGDPNGTAQQGEDVDQDGALDVYGALPEDLTVGSATGVFDNTGTTPHPRRQVNAGQAQTNRTVIFRRALKLINGGISGSVNSLPTSGLTVAAENPVYVQGNYNATTSPTAEPNVPASVVADAVTVLSNAWKDSRSFRTPNDREQRLASITGFRFAVIAGKNESFTYPTAGSPQFLFGTDGGVGNFLRLLEDWNRSGVSINYRGSIISLYYSRQATGTFKFNANVYEYGDRNFTFDTDFLEPSLLPPGTPMFRDINTLTFRQILRPNQ